MRTWQQNRFDSLNDMIEAAAQARHAANLSDGGVFNADGTRYSNIDEERKAAERQAVYVGQPYADIVGLNVACNAVYIKHIGWTPAPAGFRRAA